ncbi:UvrD-helicase domain-containing protein [Miltoncostaea marina]|uniref:UvrD-helicase domain-containing protein n=1 Tax=Miltoncostaea marina TaxID=2843215 RepID=UPI001C3C29EE|nr:UvrD-helicase domain-containing protein [Miltoncostaea marina]
MSAPSPDAAARRAIAEQLDATMLVEAGAGTGKTRALVDRVVALVARGTPIDRIAAITFTERAAAELRERVRAGLDARITAAADDPRAAARCAQARDGLDRAQLSTIHAFGQALLRALAAEAGIDPDMTVLDALAAERRFDERWRAALEDLDPDGPDGAAIDLALRRGLTIDGLRTLAARLADREDVAAAVVAAPPAAPPPPWGAIERLIGAVAAIDCSGVADEDACVVHVHALLDALEGLRGAEGWERDALLASAAALGARRLGRTGTAGAWGGKPRLDAARSVALEAGAELGRLLEAARTEALCGVLPWLARTILADAGRRRRDGTLVFGDLILWTRELLRRPDARAALRERYDVLLIDEFQDTDPWQIDIAEAFARGPGGDLEPGRLFLVGDPKQSIYRFRRADMAAYADERRRVREGGGLLPALTENRRSRSVIVDWVNAVVGRVIEETGDPALQPPYVPIAAERDVELTGPGVVCMGGPTDARAWEIRMAEATEVAAACRAAIDEGWQVQDRDAGPRPAELRDIAVLIPARTGLSTLERALRAAGVPFRVEGGSLVYRTQELRDLINCLTAIDDPSDEVAVVGALRGVAFACSDVELAEHRRAGLRFNYLAPAIDDAAGPVAEALRCLRAHHRRRHDTSLATLVERFVAERRMVEVGLVDGRSRDAYRRARFVVEQARAFEADRPKGLRAFVLWLEERTTGPILERDGSGLDDDEDAVRVLTIHASKGLEFPIVIVAGIGTSPPYAAPPTVALDAAGELVATIGSKSRGMRLSVGDVAGAEAREADHQHAEGARLLYVAATRARDHLVVSLHHHHSRARRSGACRLIAAGALDHAPAWAPPAAPAPDVTPLGDLPVEGADASPEEHDAARAALVAAARTVRYTSATGMAAAARAAEEAPPDEERGSENGDEPWSRGRGGSRVGRAVHASLQSLALAAGPDEVDAVAAAQAVAEAVPDRAAEVAGLVRSALLSDAAMRARAAAGTLREVPFALRRGDAVVEGFIDLVVPTAAGLEIVDWKTDDVAPGDVADRLAGYRLQAGLYALGLAEATGMPVARITYVFLRAGVEVSPGDPVALARAAADRVAAPA